MRRIICIFIFLLFVSSLFACGKTETKQKEYGVFLSVSENLDQFADYETIVIDAQYFDKNDIESFKEKGHKVYSYINIGSIEDFRSYYDDYRDLTLGKYENWDEEYWIDVSDDRWQSFIVDTLEPKLLDKGIDGFFVDNCDIYFHYEKEEMLIGLSNIMRSLVRTGKEVIINGGDEFLDAYCENGGVWSDVITGINQETVFSKILWDGDRFDTASDEDREYFTSYIEKYSDMGADIYLLEYTTDKELIKKIKAYCDENDFMYYISDTIELDGDE